MKTKVLIDSIEKNLKLFLGNTFALKERRALHYTVNGQSLALNKFENPQELVKVYKWFNDFWLFLEVGFKKIEKETFLNTLITLSVFQGDDSDEEKYQLFRAEWDDYHKPEEKHAQPHWHITSSQAVENTLVKCAEIFGQQDFVQILENEKQKVLDVKKVHFAMNADWQTDGTHFHQMGNEKHVVKWLLGMLNYLRIELENL
jgi:hypothetical protein